MASPKAVTCTKAARCQPQELSNATSHDSFIRLLRRQPQNTGAVRREAKATIDNRGVILVDDTTLDKPHAQKMDLVTYYWHGKHHRVVKGINVITLMWTDGKRQVPCELRVYDGHLSGITKNERFCQMVANAKQRRMDP